MTALVKHRPEWLLYLSKGAIYQGFFFLKET